jgi:3-dehydroquinate synthase
MQKAGLAMREVKVELGDRSYPVLIGSGLMSEPDLFRRFSDSKQVMVVTNEVVAPLYLQRLKDALAGAATRSLVLPDGESHKTLKEFNAIISALLDGGFGRDSLLVALGGGVVGDVTGFAAACYQRGISYIQVPTTLLAQVDSAVGGKTAVNHERGKNMIGAFHQPRAVIADTDTLATLPDRELSAGSAEIIKYGLIRDSKYFTWIEQNIGGVLRREPAALAHAIETACRIKAAVVAADEREEGQRALLNFGHSFGHAIETALGYRHWLHGEAVAAGMLMAADLSQRLGLLDAAVPPRIHALLIQARLPVMAPAGVSASQLRELMAVDKKARSGRLRLVLLRAIGEACLTDRFEEAGLLAAIARFVASPSAR